eukprot:symbB.v1.2.035547.t1/scaffold4812.1/size45942/2
MVRNIPSCYNCEELLGDILAQSFEGTFDFFYLPIDFNTKRNRGYCFLNFRSSHWAREFVRTFHGQTLTRYCTKKILEISPAVTQGLENNMTGLGHRVGDWQVSSLSFWEKMVSEYLPRSMDFFPSEFLRVRGNW